MLKPWDIWVVVHTRTALVGRLAKVKAGIPTRKSGAGFWTGGRIPRKS